LGKREGAEMKPEYSHERHTADGILSLALVTSLLNEMRSAGQLDDARLRQIVAGASALLPPDNIVTLNEARRMAAAMLKQMPN
jgi:hypothetical protein